MVLSGRCMTTFFEPQDRSPRISKILAFCLGELYLIKHSFIHFGVHLLHVRIGNDMVFCFGYPNSPFFPLLPIISFPHVSPSLPSLDCTLQTVPRLQVSPARNPKCVPTPFLSRISIPSVVLGFHN